MSTTAPNLWQEVKMSSKAPSYWEDVSNHLDYSDKQSLFDNMQAEMNQIIYAYRSYSVYASNRLTYVRMIHNYKLYVFMSQWHLEDDDDWDNWKLIYGN